MDAWIMLPLSHVTIWRVNHRAFTARRFQETCGDLGLEAALKVGLEPQLPATTSTKRIHPRSRDSHVACMFFLHPRRCASTEGTSLAQISTSSRAQVYLIPRSCLSCNMWYHIRATYGVALCPLHPDPVELISIVTECTI